MGKVLDSESVNIRDFVPPFRTGDRMSRTEFHSLYLETPKHFKAELIHGVVYVASPASYQHGHHDQNLGMLMAIYKSQTPGTGGAANATIQFDDANEVQPDQLIRIDDDFQGQSRITEDGYLTGASEFIAEVSLSTLQHDLTKKKSLYAEQGVLEYLVVDVENERLHWFNLPHDQELTLDADDILRSRVFPGLWIDSQALFGGNPQQLIATLQRGLSSPEHDAFVQLLAARRTLPPHPGI
jgi:Uma2 family endonuclease